MTLGKNIYDLRTAKNLSQGDLADLLDVSRQSVSKWETDAAIPDLDKLMKMCDVFEITLDELTGRTPQEKEGKTVTVVEKISTLTPQKIVGYILLATTLIATILLFALADDIETFYIPLPILISTLVCSLICLFVKEYAGYWCTWAALAPVCILSFHIISLPILTTAGIMQIMVYIIMSFAAYRIFKDYTVQTSKLKSILLAIGFTIGIAAYIVAIIFAPLDWIGMCIINYITYSVLALLLTYIVCYIKNLMRK